MRSFGASHRVAVAISPDFRLALTSGPGETINIWYLTGCPERRGVNGEGFSARAAANSNVVEWSFGTELGDWGESSGEAIRVLRDTFGFDDASGSLTLAPDGRAAVLRLWPGTLVPAGPTAGFYAAPDAKRVDFLATSSDGRFVLFRDSPSGMQLWDTGTARSVLSLRGNAFGVLCGSVSSDGRYALSSGFDKTVRLWDLTDGNEVRTFIGHAAPVDCVSFSPDGRSALSHSGDGVIKLWELDTGRERRTLQGHVGSVRSLAVFPDGRFGVSLGADIVKFWDLTSGRELRSFSDDASALGVSADGGLIMLASYRNVRVWDLSRVARYDELEPKVTAAREALQSRPDDATALATLGEWYAFRGVSNWAVDLLEQARSGGADVSPMTLALSYWQLGRTDDARREFRAALSRSRDDRERAHVQLCLQAVDGRTAVAAVALEPVLAGFDTSVLKDPSNPNPFLNRARYRARRGMFVDAANDLAKAISVGPEDHWSWYNRGCVLAYLRETQAYHEHCRQMIKRFARPEQVHIGERTAKIALLLPVDLEAEEQTGLRRWLEAAVNAGGNYLPYYQMGMGLLEYRAGKGHFEAALDWLDKSATRLRDTHQSPAVALLRAMALHRLGRLEQARAAFDTGQSDMKRLPRAGVEDLGNDVYDWLLGQTIYREASELFAAETPASSTPTTGPGVAPAAQPANP